MDKLFIFMEYCPLSLDTLISQRGAFHENISKVIVLQILEALEYIHGKEIVHRDIKPRNILVGMDKKFKISDFGSSQYKEKALRGGIESGSFNGTPNYMSPEGKPIFVSIMLAVTGNYGSRLGSQDVWSLGATLTEMMTGLKPWGTIDNEWAIVN